MAGSRKLTIALVSSLVAIALVSMLQWRYVGIAQSRMVAEMAAMYGALFSVPGKLLSNPDVSRLPTAVIDFAGLPSTQAELAMTRSAMSVLGTLTILSGCFATSLFSRSKWPSVVVAVFGCASMGLVAALLAHQDQNRSRTAHAGQNGSASMWRLEAWREQMRGNG